MVGALVAYQFPSHPVPPHSAPSQPPQLRSRHIAAIYIYFLSFGHAPQGPRLKKADLRRDQSATITIRRPGHAGARTTEGDDDAGTLSLDLADLLAASSSSGAVNANANANTGVGVLSASNSGGDAAKEEVDPATALRALSSSSLGGSGSASGGGGKGKAIAALLASKLPPFRVTITQIIRRRRSAALASAAGRLPRTQTTSQSSSSSSSSSSSGGGGSGSGPGHLLFSVSEETATTATTAVVEGGGVLITAATMTSTIITTTTSSSSSSLPATANALLPQQQPLPAAITCQHHFAPYQDKRENRNHVRCLLAPTQAGRRYREVETGEMPAMARATDAEMRELMEADGGYLYKQHRGHLFLRVSRAW